MAKKIVIIILIFSLSSCKFFQQKKVKIIAEVGDKTLLKSELAEVIPADATADDSLFIADNYIRQWITKQLIVNKAETYLSQEEKNVQRLVEDYRNSLLIHLYQQNFVQQNLDTIVTQKQINAYYKQFPNNLKTNKNLIKAVFVKIRKPIHVKSAVLRWLKSDKKEDNNSLKEFCVQQGAKYDIFKDEWVEADLVLNKLPLKINDQKNFLIKNKYVITEDKYFHYFLKIKALNFANSTVLLDNITENAKKIIVNKRKLELINKLEKEIYNEAKNKREFKIY